MPPISCTPSIHRPPYTVCGSILDRMSRAQGQGRAFRPGPGDRNDRWGYAINLAYRVRILLGELAGPEGSRSLNSDSDGLFLGRWLTSCAVASQYPCDRLSIGWNLLLDCWSRRT